MFTDEYPSRLLERAVSEVSKLPSIGRRSALRLALHLLARPEEQTDALCQSLMQLRHEVKHCQVCRGLSDTPTCPLCSDPARDRSLVCVVENVRSVLSIEATGQYRGLYHVLGGLISPMDGIGPGQLEIDSLEQRVKAGGVAEVILALSPTMEGDTTGFCIVRRLRPTGVRLTELARGVAVGDELEYADELTLSRAMQARTPVKDS